MKNSRVTIGQPVALALAAVLGFTAISAQAVTIPFTEALTYSYNPDATGIGVGPGQPVDYINTVNSAPASAATASYSQSGLWGSVAATASADLAAGQLKMSASASATPNGGANPYSQSNAIFGDGFTATTAGGTPFAFTSATTAAFNLALSGSFATTLPNSGNGGGAFVILSILDKGTLDPTKPLIGGANMKQYFYWNIGNPNYQVYYTDQGGNSTQLTPTGSFTNIPSNITQVFNPGGNFDWVLLLGASGQVGPGDSFNADLSHTLTFSYEGPAGSITTSDSGQFTNYNLPVATVPEPGTLGLVLMGVIPMLARRRRADVGRQPGQGA